MSDNRCTSTPLACWGVSTPLNPSDRNGVVNLPALEAIHEGAPLVATPLLRCGLIGKVLLGPIGNVPGALLILPHIHEPDEQQTSCTKCHDPHRDKNRCLIYSKSVSYTNGGGTQDTDTLERNDS